MMRRSPLFQEVSDDIFDIHKGDIKIRVDDYFVSFPLIGQFLFGFFDALFEAVFTFCIAVCKAAD